MRRRMSWEGASVQAGPARINSHGPQAINYLAPFGDVKQSDVGRKSGIDGILEYVQAQQPLLMSDDGRIVLADSCGLRPGLFR